MAPNKPHISAHLQRKLWAESLRQVCGKHIRELGKLRVTTTGGILTELKEAKMRVGNAFAASR